MEAVFTLPNIFSMLILVVGWSIKRELQHISENIEDVRDIAKDAHRRLDVLVSNH